MNASFEIQNLNKSFGKIKAVNNLSLCAHKGELIALLGPNGAGKSTLMNMMTGFLAPDSGTIKIFSNNLAVDPLLCKKQIGFLPEGSPLYYDMSVKSFLNYMAELKSVNLAEVTRVMALANIDGIANVYINIMVLNRQYLISIINNAIVHGANSFGRDILAKNVDCLKLYGYELKDYYAGIDSLQTYYAHNLEMLDQQVRNQLFGARDIYTKVKDSAPSKYSETAVVKNSLISDGCVIEGTVENSILFRGVKVEKGAVVKNSIIMQDNVIGKEAQLNAVITDKNVVIRDRRTLSGCAEYPFFIPKGAMV